jgi:Leishmanolysin
MQGIGTQWESLQVTGLRSSKCPYKGPRANAEYKNITGCDVVPTENDGDPNGGTFCGHWDEECLRSELMTGVLTGVLHPLSRITIATLQDLGYTVDYSSAETYTRGDVLSSCLCNRRSLMDSSSNGDAHQLGRSLGSTERRSLSDKGLQQAVNYGQAILQERKRTASVTVEDDPNPIGGDILFVGDKLLMVFVEEAGAFFDVVVTLSL